MTLSVMIIIFKRLDSTFLLLSVNIWMTLCEFGMLTGRRIQKQK